MFLKSLGVKYLSRYKSYPASWIVLVQSVTHSSTFRIEELLISTDKQITGTGTDELGPFKISGTVSKQGFAEFEKRYTTGSCKTVINFHGSFGNGNIKGNWVIKGQGLGTFDMKMEKVRPFEVRVGNVRDVIHIAFMKDNTRLHAIGQILDFRSLQRKFFILNGKILGTAKGKTEIAVKLFYPDSSDQDYFLGTIEGEEGNRILRGTMENHSDKQWFSKASPLPFEIQELNSTLQSIRPQDHAIANIQTPFDDLPSNDLQHSLPQSNNLCGPNHLPAGMTSNPIQYAYQNPRSYHPASQLPPPPISTYDLRIRPPEPYCPPKIE